MIMGIALAISLGYSVKLNQQANKGESTVTTTSIIEMTATTVTIKNTLTGTGEIKYKEKEQPGENKSTQNNQSIEQTQENTYTEQIQDTEETQQNNIEAENATKAYKITLSIEDKDLGKAKVGQDVEIAIKKEEEILNFFGKVIKINQDVNNKSTIDVELLNPSENIQENEIANCTVIVEKAENVVGLPIEAVQKNEQGQDFVDVVQIDGTIKPVVIKTGISDAYYTEITYGLNVGDRVQIVKSSTTVVNENTNLTSEN